MKIALVSTQFFGTPPPKYGGLERVVYDLANGLTGLGHKVVLFAPDESKVPENGYLFKTGKALDTVNVDWLKTESEMVAKAEPYFKDFDIVHENNWFGSCYGAKVRNPSLKICHTHHGGIQMEWWGKPRPKGFHLNLIAISNWMKRVYASQGFESQVSYNPIDLTEYEFKKEKGDRLLFVGRLDSFKRPHIAIEAAKRLGIGLDIVGGSFVSDVPYMERVKSQCDAIYDKEHGGFIDSEPDRSNPIILHLDASQEEKIGLYQNAKAVIFPSRMGEPFGLIVPENSACGGFTIGMNDGAIPETIIEGVNGFVVGKPSGQHSDEDDVQAVVDGVRRLGHDGYDPVKCRKVVEERFSREACAKRYEILYSDIMNGLEW